MSRARVLPIFRIMNKRLPLILCLCISTCSAWGQAKLRKMPANINNPAINNYAPYLALDGNSMLYLADVAEDNALTLNYTARIGTDWQDPVILPRTINNHLNYLTGFALSPDGSILYISNSKSNGMGGYDIYSCQRKGNSWAEPVNLLVPINSRMNDACPSPSADGTAFYFMRCEVMNNTLADKCKLMVTFKKPNGQWDEPIELPSFINTGNSQSPRIMGDGETLLFASNKLQPNKGKMDVYITRLKNGQWSVPQPADFINTDADDQFVTASSLGRYLVRDARGTRSNELVELLFPAELRPKTTVKIEGIVSGPENPGSAFISIFDLKDQRKVFSAKPGPDGQFVAYMTEGSVYDLSIEPEKDNFTFFSQVYDLTKEKFPLLEKVKASIKAAASGDEIMLEGISFLARTAELNPSSSQELRRLKRMMEGNPNKSFAITVSMAGYQVDSVRSNPDLTETLIDSVRIPVRYKIDSVTTGTRDSIVVKLRYHNNRTSAQASALRDYFIRQGIKADRVRSSGIAVPEPLPESQKIRVKLTIQ